MEEYVHYTTTHEMLSYAVVFVKPSLLMGKLIELPATEKEKIRPTIFIKLPLQQQHNRRL